MYDSDVFFYCPELDYMECLGACWRHSWDSLELYECEWDCEDFCPYDEDDY